MTVTSSTYDPILRRLISAHKERQALALTSFLAERLALSVHGLLASGPYAVRTGRIVLVPIPSAASTVRQRGFDATAAMARLAARRLRGRYPVTVRSVTDRRDGGSLIKPGWAQPPVARTSRAHSGCGGRSRPVRLFSSMTW